MSYNIQIQFRPTAYCIETDVFHSIISIEIRFIKDPVFIESIIIYPAGLPFPVLHVNLQQRWMIVGMNLTKALTTIQGCRNHRAPPPDFNTSDNPIPTMGGRLCPSHYRPPHQIFKPSYGPVHTQYVFSDSHDFFFIAGLGSEGGNMSWKTAVQKVKIEHGNQQRTNAPCWRRKFVQVSLKQFLIHTTKYVSM